MYKLLKTVSSKFCTALTSNLNTLPVHNGGLKTINKDTLNRYANLKLEAADQSISKGDYLIKSVSQLKNTIEENPVLKMYLEGGLRSIPKGGILYGTSLNQFFHTLSTVCMQPPKFQDNQITGVPFYSLFFDLLDTKLGQSFFGTKTVNNHLKDIFNDYNVMLSSRVSLKHMNEEEPNGWFSRKAQSYWDFHQD